MSARSIKKISILYCIFIPFNLQTPDSRAAFAAKKIHENIKISFILLDKSFRSFTNVSKSLFETYKLRNSHAISSENYSNNANIGPPFIKGVYPCVHAVYN